MLRRFASNLIIVLGCMAFAIVGLGPRGAALCIGGGHSLGEMIVAACESGGHTHGGETDHDGHAEPHACLQESDSCGLPHEHHVHDDGHAPCADIPLDQDEYRGGAGSSVKFAVASLASLEPVQFMLPWVSPRVESGVPRLLHSSLGSVIAVAQTQFVLRAVVLQV